MDVWIGIGQLPVWRMFREGRYKALEGFDGTRAVGGAAAMDLAMRVSEKDARFWSIKSVECTVGCRVRLGLCTIMLMMIFCADMNTSPADLATIDDPHSSACVCDLTVCLYFGGCRCDGHDY
jgi:hypothetical protein